MIITRRSLLLLGCAFVAACGEDDAGMHTSSPLPSPPPPPPPPGPPPPPPPPVGVTLTFSFANDAAGWEAGHADYPVGKEPEIGFTSGHGPVGPELPGVSGLYTSARNVSDDEFMYIFRLVTGVAPNTAYKVEVAITFATNAPPGCLGVGGAPGEGVTIKAGATPVKPASVANAQNQVRVNFDKGNQTQSGASAVAIGNFAQDAPGDCLNPVYKPKTLSTSGHGPTVTSDSSGQLWLVLGTDSGFEAATKIYYLEGTATLTPA